MPIEQQQLCSVNSQKWYKCAFPVAIFSIFTFLFIYSLVAIIKCSELITDKHLEEKGLTLNQVFAIYIINLIVTFVSLLIIVFFIYRLIPKETAEGLFNDYVGIAVSIYILVVSSCTIHLFSRAQNTVKADINAMGGIALILACLAIIIYSLKIYVYIKFDANDLSFASLQQAFKKKKP